MYTTMLTDKEYINNFNKQNPDTVLVKDLAHIFCVNNEKNYKYNILSFPPKSTLKFLV